MPESLIGTVLNQAYRVDQLIADGGMSYVYRATQLNLNRPVVLKVLRPGFKDEDFIELFLREARVNSQIAHPNVVGVFDFDRSEEGIVYLAMEFLDGSTLKDVVNSQKRVSVAKALWVMEQVCAGVHAAHKLNIVHRDIKPNNIMICELTGGGTSAKVLDFGISKPLSEEDLKHTRMGMVMGTPGYLSPEQISGGYNIDTRADIYALGAILHFMLTGENPYAGASMEIIMHKQMTQLPARLKECDIKDPEAASLQPILDQAMAVEREERFPDVQSFWQALVNASSSHQKIKTEQEEALKPLATAYQFVFTGKVKNNQSKNDVAKKLLPILKVDKQQLGLLFSGRRIIVRKNISKNNAEHFQKLFDKAGAEGIVEEMPSATRILPKQHLSKQHQPKQQSGNTPPPSSFPSIGMLEPITLGEIQSSHANNTTNSDTAGQSGIRSLTKNHFSADNQKKKLNKTKISWIASTALVITLTLTAALYPPVKYTITDFYAYNIQGNTPPRGVTATQIRLGMSAAFSGSAREIGQAMKIGINAYLKTMNEQGGIHGRTIQLTDIDDGYEPEKALKNISHFVDNEKGVLAMLGNVGTPTAKAILPIAMDNQMIVFGTFSGASLLRNNPPDRYVFNYRASYAEETSALIHYYIGQEKIAPDRIAVFYQNDSYGLDGLSGVERALHEYDIDKNNIVKANYTRNTAIVENPVNYFSRQLTHIEAIILVSTYAASAEFVHQMRKAGYAGKFANVSFVGSRALAERLQELGESPKDIIISQVVPPFDGYATGVLAYREALQRYYPNEQPNYISLEGYIAAAIFVKALQDAGRYFSNESLIDTIESIDNYDPGIGAQISFNRSNHQASQRVWGSAISSNGKFTTIELEPYQHHTDEE